MARKAVSYLNALVQTWNMSIKSILFKLKDSLCIFLKPVKSALKNKVKKGNWFSTIVHQHTLTSKCNQSSSVVTMTNTKLLKACFLPGYQPVPLFLIHYHWRSAQNISLSRFKNLVPVGRLRFSPVHLTCFCQRLCMWECVSMHAYNCGCGCAYCWESELRAFAAERA